jgi:hypothetical protein
MNINPLQTTTSLTEDLSQMTLNYFWTICEIIHALLSMPTLVWIDFRLSDKCRAILLLLLLHTLIILLFLIAVLWAVVLIYMLLRAFYVQPWLERREAWFKLMVADAGWEAL